MILDSPSHINQELNIDQLNLLRRAFILPFAGSLFDYFDGKVARWSAQGSSMLGQELDSLADLGY
jgi:phosphatidylserine synthase